MPETLCDYLSRITDENTVINICDKDKTIHFCNKFKDIMFSHIVDSLGHDVIAVPTNRYLIAFCSLYAKFKAEMPDPDVSFTLQEQSDGMSISINLKGNKESAWYAKCHNNGRISGSSSLRQRDTAHSYHLYSFLRKYLDISNDYQESFADTEDPHVYFTATIKENHD